MQDGISLCFHGPTDIPLMNRHEKIRNAGLERLYEMIDMAIDMGSEYFIFHPGRQAFYSITTKKMFFIENRFPKEVSLLFSESLKRILEYSGDRIKICLENTNFIAPLFLEALNDLTANHGLYLVWDAGHTENSSPSKRESIIRYYRDNLKYIKMGHLHDYRDGGGHKAIGNNKVDVGTYLEIFNTLGVDIILEIFPESELLMSLEYLENMQLTNKTK